MSERRLTPQALTWRRAEQPNDWCELLPSPDINAGFFEKTRFLFQKPGVHWSFRVDDEPLAEDGGVPPCWTWEPGFYAGEVTAELLTPHGTRAGLYLLDVAPEPGKLGRDLFSRLVADLWSADPTLVIGTEPATSQMGELGSLEDPWVAFARLRQHAPGYLRALTAVRAHPRRTLRVRRASSPVHQVRRADRRTAQAVARSAAAVLFAPAGEEGCDLARDTRLDVPVIDESLDSAANRASLALLLAVLRRAESLLKVLQRCVERATDSETRTSLKSRWPARRQFMIELAAGLRRLLRRPPFSEVLRPEITAAGLTAVAADPVYSRSWTTGWRAIRRGLASGTNLERLWISPSWEIYERWCFLRVGQLLEVYAPHWSWQRVPRPHRWLGLQDGRSAVLELQPLFRSLSASSSGRWSVSRQREPDLVLRVDEPDGSCRFVVLDAKYRATRSNVLDAMSSAHVYQDSLRIGQQRPEASLLLVPAGGGATWLEQEAFQQQHRVGVHPLAPDINRLPLAVRDLLAEVSSAT